MPIAEPLCGPFKRRRSRNFTIFGLHSKPWLESGPQSESHRKPGKNCNRSFAAMKKFANQGSVVDYYEANAEFHLEIIRTSGNKSLANIYDSICKQVSLFRKSSLSLPGRLNISLEQHQEILAALLSGDGKKAGASLRHHVLDAGHALVSALSKTKPGNKLNHYNLTRRPA